MFELEYKSMAESLQAAKDVISLMDNQALQPMKIRLISLLTKEINALQTLAGVPVTGEIQNILNSEPKPLTKMFGKSVNQNVKPKERTVVLEPVSLKQFAAEQKTLSENAAVNELRAKVELLYPEFRTIDSASILDSYDELTIKGVAKYAGLPVSDNSPKKVDTAFIDSIKEAIRVKQEVENEMRTVEETIS